MKTRYYERIEWTWEKLDLTREQFSARCGRGVSVASLKDVQTGRRLSRKAHTRIATTLNELIEERQTAAAPGETKALDSILRTLKQNDLLNGTDQIDATKLAQLWDRPQDLILQEKHNVEVPLASKSPIQIPHILTHVAFIVAILVLGIMFYSKRLDLESALKENSNLDQEVEYLQREIQQLKHQRQQLLPPESRPKSGADYEIEILGLWLAWIPPGHFIMGSPPDEPGRYSNEGPQTEITITYGFWIGVYEVTQAQYLYITRHNPSHFDAGRIKDEELWQRLPVESVSWKMATNYCHMLTLHEREAGRLGNDLVYRLPTEAEWEYACRAGTTSAIYSGELNIVGQFIAPALDAVAWHRGNSQVTHAGGWDSSTWPGDIHPPGTTIGTHLVGEKEPNAWGLYDMLGNVWEWCQDGYTNSLPGGAVTNWWGPNESATRVRRGGTHGDQARKNRSATREGMPPTKGENNGHFGFRLVLAPIEQSSPN